MASFMMFTSPRLRNIPARRLISGCAEALGFVPCFQQHVQNRLLLNETRPILRSVLALSSSHFLHTLLGDLDVLGVYVNAYAMPSRLLRGHTRRSASQEWIKHHLVALAEQSY